jgi:uncharacterized repeat protein (TIGR01451 family)
MVPVRISDQNTSETDIMNIRIKAHFGSAIAIMLLACCGAGATDVAPPPSGGHKMTYDSARHRIVLYGLTTTGGTGSTQTWVWDGGWILKTPSASPPPAFNGAMAYDEASQQALFYGGSVGRYANTNGTWAWDGTNWTVLASSNRPPARYGHSMAYDATHQQFVLFGGDMRTNTTYLATTNDTWVWSGAGWLYRNPSAKPSKRTHAGMAFDGARGEIVLFGGLDNRNGGGDFNDTWTWNGTDWTLKAPASHPPALNLGSAMIYDSVRREVLLFGGLPSSGSYNETWGWNGTNWTLKTPSVRPPPRWEHAMTFDPVRGKAVLFGGNGSPSGALLSDTWLWDGTNWYSSDLILNVATPASTVRLGSNLTYMVTVTNKGPSVAEEVVLAEELPTSVAVVSATASQGSCSYSSGGVRCSLGSVPAGTSVTVSVTVAPLAIGVITNTATVLCAAELNPSNNIAKVATTVVSPPVVNTPLTDQIATAGAQLVLSVDVYGSSPLSYEWFFNGTNLVAQGTPWLSLTNLDCSQAGYYTVVVSNPWGTVTNTALVSVNELRMYAGIRIGGAPGVTYQVAARNSLRTNDTWFTLTNVALPYSPYLFIDEDSPNHPQRFYSVTAMR